jgi:hypothetical protein
MHKSILLLFLPFFVIAQETTSDIDLELYVDLNQTELAKNDTLIMYVSLKNRGEKSAIFRFHEVLFNISLNNSEHKEKLPIYTGSPYINLYYDLMGHKLFDEFEKNNFFIPIFNKGTYKYQIILNQLLSEYSPGTYEICLLYSTKRGHKYKHYWIGYLQSNIETFKILD